MALKDSGAGKAAEAYDLIVVGGGPAGLSAAFQAVRAGLDRVLILRFPEFAKVPLPLNRGRIAFQDILNVKRVHGEEGSPLTVETDTDEFHGKVCLLDAPTVADSPFTPTDVPASITERIHQTDDFDPAGDDALVVGDGERAALLTLGLVERGARVVLAFVGAYDGLSPFSKQILEGLERDQRATVLWQSTPDGLWDEGGFPMVGFADRMTPDLQFDHVVYLSTGPSIESFEKTLDDEADSRLVTIDLDTKQAPDVVPPAKAWEAIRKLHFAKLQSLTPRATSNLTGIEARELEKKFYNATITRFDTAHNELWRIRVKPDRRAVAHQAGQYCSLGLGYWEPRADDAHDRNLELRQRKLVRRSYSISSPIFDPHGYLVNHADMGEIELYIVWVRPDQDRIPGLTPRLALKHPGDRIYLGPKVAGRYTINPVTNPDASVVFCSTGTGEAPHNSMVVELLRKGHIGPILSVVTVRYWSDLAYLEEHRNLEQRYPNFRYLPLPTREPDTVKRYIQDLILDGTLEDSLGRALDPAESHVFLCGNPAMIGLPQWVDDRPVFPSTQGVSELLYKRGLRLDRRNEPGQIHFEEYW